MTMETSEKIKVILLSVGLLYVCLRVYVWAHSDRYRGRL